jgi:preprotein translocase subunit SecG
MMHMVLLGGFFHYLFGILLFATSVFLILLVLVQRGRGGGLAGAFGGMGGQSAFGTKAGDVFTRVTMGTAAVWIILAVMALKFLGGTGGSNRFGDINPTGPPGISAGPETTDGDENSTSKGQAPGTGTSTSGAGAGGTAPGGANSSPAGGGNDQGAAGTTP